MTLQKGSRGLGLSVNGGGKAGPIRVNRLFPQQPAALSNKLQPGDILLAANGTPLTGLSDYVSIKNTAITFFFICMLNSFCNCQGKNRHCFCFFSFFSSFEKGLKAIIL